MVPNDDGRRSGDGGGDDNAQKRRESGSPTATATEPVMRPWVGTAAATAAATTANARGRTGWFTQWQTWAVGGGRGGEAQTGNGEGRGGGGGRGVPASVTAWVVPPVALLGERQRQGGKRAGWKGRGKEVQRGRWHPPRPVPQLSRLVSTWNDDGSPFAHRLVIEWPYMLSGSGAGTRTWCWEIPPGEGTEQWRQ